MEMKIFGVCGVKSGLLVKLQLFPFTFHDMGTRSLGKERVTPAPAPRVCLCRDALRSGGAAVTSARTHLVKRAAD